MFRPELAVLLSTFERPGHLRRALVSIARQVDVRGRFELIVTDDGSKDETASLVADFARRVDFPVRLTTHPHDGFQLAKCRNEGVRASDAPYLLFLDGDCVLPRDHLAQHLRRRRPGVVMAGDCYRLDQVASAAITDDVIARDELLHWVPAGERRRLGLKAVRAKCYEWLNHPTLPRLTGNNIGIWREDFERVNGFDEKFRGWGMEDRNLQWRLSRQRLRFASSLTWTYTCHLWHPPHPTFVRNNDNTPNQTYMRRAGWLSCCRFGLRARPVTSLRYRLLGARPYESRLPDWLRAASTGPERRSEIEMLFLPSNASFSGDAEHNVLVALQDSPRVERLARQAHLVVANQPVAGSAPAPTFPLHRLEEALETIT